jgi:hypothetical protein
MKFKRSKEFLSSSPRLTWKKEQEGSRGIVAIDHLAKGNQGNTDQSVNPESPTGITKLKVVQLRVHRVLSGQAIKVVLIRRGILLLGGSVFAPYNDDVSPF